MGVKKGDSLCGNDECLNGAGEFDDLGEDDGNDGSLAIAREASKV